MTDPEQQQLTVRDKLDTITRWAQSGAQWQRYGDNNKLPPEPCRVVGYVDRLDEEGTVHVVVKPVPSTRGFGRASEEYQFFVYTYAAWIAGMTPVGSA